MPDVSSEKNPNAVELGRLGGAKGGRARAESLSAERRSQIARQAALQRWKDHAPRPDPCASLIPLDVRRALEIERHRRAMAELDAEEHRAHRICPPGELCLHEQPCPPRECRHA